MQYTLVITSSGRHHLLKQTWEMFQAAKDLGPSHTVIVEDGPMEHPYWLPKHNITWLTNGTRRGQIYSVDRAYERVKTPYIFHCEDDWGFSDKGFLQESLDILEKYPEVLQVWLRGIPTESDKRDRFQIHTVESHPIHPFHIAQYRWEDWKGGFSFNPGLRRLADYRRIGSYGRHVGYDPRGCGERAIGLLYHNLGYCSAILPKSYIYHIGDESHVDRKMNPAAPKILVAIPTAETLDYSAFRIKQKSVYGRNWPGGISGLQHDGPNTRRLAVEETWLKDFAPHSNVTARFFTGKDLGTGDDFMSMPAKIKAMCQWAVDNNFDWMFRPDDDTFVYTDRLVRAIYERPADFAGFDCGGIALGGAGILLSRKALEILANSSWTPGEWRDDAFISDTLKANGIRMTDWPGLASNDPNWYPGVPLTQHPISPEKMKQLYEAY